jgi:hypothetical protein
LEVAKVGKRNRRNRAQNAWEKLEKEETAPAVVVIKKKTKITKVDEDIMIRKLGAANKDGVLDYLMDNFTLNAVLTFLQKKGHLDKKLPAKFQAALDAEQEGLVVDRDEAHSKLQEVTE